MFPGQSYKTGSSTSASYGTNSAESNVHLESPLRDITHVNLPIINMEEEDSFLDEDDAEANLDSDDEISIANHGDQMIPELPGGVMQETLQHFSRYMTSILRQIPEAKSYSLQQQFINMAINARMDYVKKHPSKSSKRGCFSSLPTASVNTVDITEIKNKQCTKRAINRKRRINGETDNSTPATKIQHINLSDVKEEVTEDTEPSEVNLGLETTVEAMEEMKYAVVEFPLENTVGVICIKWLTAIGDKCYYPDKKQRKLCNMSDMLQNEKDASPGWGECPITILSIYGSYKEAKAGGKKAGNTLNLSEEEDDQKSFEEQCLTKLNFLVRKMKELSEDVLELRRSIEKDQLAAHVPDELEAKFPLQTIEELESFESDCQDPNLIKICVETFSRIGGQNLLQVTINVLRRLLSPQLSIQYSFEGRKSKRTFKGLSLYKIVLGVARTHYKAATEGEVRAIVSRWLTQSRLRLERHQQKKEKENANNEDCTGETA